MQKEKSCCRSLTAKSTVDWDNMTNHKTTPRPYLSWTQLNLIETSVYQYVRTYVYEEKFSNPRMELGKRVAEMIEAGTVSADLELEHLRTFLPIYPEREYALKGEISGVPIYGKLDGFNPESLHLGEYKTGVRWNAKMVAESGQISFYALLVLLNYRMLPKRITLTWMPTETRPDGSIHVTGDIQNFETYRTMEDILLIAARIKKGWKKIQEVCAIEYKSIGLL